MNQNRILASILLASLFLPLLFHPAFATPIAVTVSRSGVQLIMNLQFTENITALPRMKAHIDQSNSSQITTPVNDALQGAIRRLVPAASIDRLELSVATSNSSGPWTLWENYTIGLAGITTNYGSSISTNISFLSFNVTDPLGIDGNELNYAPRAYLLANLTTTNPSQTTYYYINGHQTLTPTIPEITTNILHLLDFTWVPSLADWQETQDILGQSTTWSYNPSSARYNLTFGSPTPERTLIQAYEAVYNPSIQLTVPAGAWLTGNTLHFDIPSYSEYIMPGLLLVSLAALIATVLIDRRLQVKSVKKRKR